MVSIISLSSSAGRGQSVCLSPSDQEEDVNMCFKISLKTRKRMSVCVSSLSDP